MNIDAPLKVLALKLATMPKEQLVPLRRVSRETLLVVEEALYQARARTLMHDLAYQSCLLSSPPTQTTVGRREVG